ncbi:hypothetical protein G7Y89_g13314 [Cudoniella acicularis]|uniref:Histone deacetylase domain-containing protein n=1 Tax=Cudoniella acicularis TaxID=354080 RepID=A0A8H4VYD4_9HELO|nr:hypothetical protein G7Y89_g13314 [Cudoniella acicularis]
MAPSASSETPKGVSTNNTAFQNSLKRFSIGTAASTALPPSPSSPRNFAQNNLSSPNGRTPSRSPLPRSPSSMSVDARSSTPSLLRKKVSMNSLHGVGGVTPPRSSPSRASSAHFMNGSTMVGRSPLSGMEEVERPPRHTASSIAHNHFEKELELHGTEDDSRQTDTIAILHDSCYGHRYSRPRTSKASLNTIVERPERIHASILGLSVAYVRLGERHSEGSYPLHPVNDPLSIPSIPFRIRKTTRRLPLSSPAVTNVHGAKWMEELKIMCNNAEAKLAMNGKELTRPDVTRSPEHGTPPKLHEGDLYLCSESLDAMEGALGAVCEGVDSIFQGSTSGKGPHRAFVAIRPPGHHCSASYPSGFCWLNNVHVGISHAALTHGLTHAAIIDFDLHHGDGSQSIAWDHNSRAVNLPKNALPWKKTSIGYFSLHDINSYPCEMGDEEKVKNASLCIENAHGQSIWNVHLQPWKSEAEFWELYETKYSVLLEKTRNFLQAQTDRLRAVNNGPKPKAVIFISAGFDASEWESSGMQRHKVNVPTEFYARLTRDIVNLAAEDGTALEGRVISVLEGGYSDRALYSGVFSHLSGLASGGVSAIKKEINHGGLGYEMGQKIGTFNGARSFPAEPESLEVQTYDPLWWSLPRLEQLDATVSPPAPPPEPKKPRDGTPPTYSSPTQSFIAKVVSPRAQRSVSSMSFMGGGSPRARSRPPSPPPPEVHWTVAAHELSKLLIPTDRQTMSCKPEDLSAEATRARRDRQSILTPPAETSGPEPGEPSNTRMALRVRKPAKVIEAVEEDEVKKPAPKTNRRKTVAGAASIATDKAVSRSMTPVPLPEPSYTKPTSQSSRRLSLASNAGSVTSEAASSRTNGNSRAPSNGSVANYQRPGTSQSVRPDSSMSSRGHSIPPVVVKKTRAPAKPRAEPAKSSRVRRKSPLNEGTKDTSSIDAPPVPSRSSSVVLPSIEPATSQASDIDSLTSGMQKVKISLTTKAQREAKEQAKQATKNTRIIPPKAARSRSTAQSSSTDMSDVTPPAPERAGTKTPLNSNEDQISFNFPPMPSTPQQNLPQPLPSHVQHATEIPLPASSPVGPSLNKPQNPALINSETKSDIFISYQPEGPTPDAIPQQEPIRWLPPNTATPSPMKRVDLPVFTSSSVIPFAPNLNLGGQASGHGHNVDLMEGVQKTLKDDSNWEVPETPRNK